jgi:hypothetical protein
MRTHSEAMKSQRWAVVVFVVLIALLVGESIVLGPKTKAAQDQLLHEIGMLPPPPGGQLLNRVERRKPGLAQVGDRLRVRASPDQVRSYYDGLLARQGWKECASHSHRVVYCRDRFKATLTFESNPPPGGWDVAIDLTWSIWRTP